MASITVPDTHSAVVTAAKGAPLELLSVPTVPPKDDEIVVRIS
jgi:Zn-dependent alcohol dehydrogenase